MVHALVIPALKEAEAGEEQQVVASLNSAWKEQKKLDGAIRLC